MAWTSTQLAALKDALASGKLSIRFGDRSIQYRSVDELRKAIAIVEKEVNGASATKVVKAYFASDY